MPYGAGTAFESAYVYGLDNPFRFTDPSGLRATSCYSGGGKPCGCGSPNPLSGPPLSPGLVAPIPVSPPIVMPPLLPIVAPWVVILAAPFVLSGDQNPEQKRQAQEGTKYPGQTCTNVKLGELQREMKRICNQKRSCAEQGLECGEIAKRLGIANACLRARVRIQDECFGGKADPPHAKEIRQAQKVVSKCETAFKDRGCA
jgi:hypothetical protein